MLVSETSNKKEQNKKQQKKTLGVKSNNAVKYFF
jgi:hypothetical protein